MQFTSVADRAKQIPFTTDTHEYIGSISKQFTAMGIMIYAYILLRAGRVQQRITSLEKH